MLSSILTAIAALPKILDYLDKIGKWVQSEQYQKWSADLESSINKLEEAKDIEEQISATRDLQRLIGRMR